MINPSSLKTYTLKDLAQMARKRGVLGWHAMRKDQLVRALTRPAKTAASHASNGKSGNGKATPGKSSNGKAAIGKHPKKASAARPAAASKPPVRQKLEVHPPQTAARNPRLLKRLAQAKAKTELSKNLARENGHPGAGHNGSVKDRLVVMVRGSYWLHACWELTSQGIARAQAAMAQEWHTAAPVLRLMTVSTGGATSNAERVLRDIHIHGGVKDWYVDVVEPPQSFRLEIGYLAANGKFFSLARSNMVTTPAPAAGEVLDPHWSDVVANCDKIYAMSGGYSVDNCSTELQELFEERMRRPMGSPVGMRYGVGAERLLPRNEGFQFEVDAELIIHGATRPDSYVTMQGEPVKLRPDGTFTARLDMPNRRQVIPVVASSRDGVEQRTIVLAIERNTKVMEPVIRDSND